jgi:hypothetical protein
MYDCVLCVGGSAKGDWPSWVGSTGEYTVVASANRGVRGIFSDASDDDELDDVRSRDKGSGRFFWLYVDILRQETNL